jgi:hypothetical protein
MTQIPRLGLLIRIGGVTVVKCGEAVVRKVGERLHLTFGRVISWRVSDPRLANNIRLFLSRVRFIKTALIKFSAYIAH